MAVLHGVDGNGGGNKKWKDAHYVVEKKTWHNYLTVDLEFGIVVVRDVPAKVCSQCGEEWIEPDIAKELEKITDAARQTHSQLEVLSFQPV